MIESPELPAESRVARARAEFVTTLGRRLTALHNTLRQLEEDPASSERRDMLTRRVHALGAAARVLGFDGVAEALADAENALARSAVGGPVSANDLAEVSRSLDLLPSIAWGAKVPSRTLTEVPRAAEIVELGWPLGILIYGPAALRTALVAQHEEPLVECEVAEDAESFRELAQRLGPDVAVIDGDRRGARELLESLVHDPLIEPFPAIVVGTFDQPEAASSFVALGAARVLPKPVGPDALQRAVIETARHETALRGPRAPLGDVTIDELTTRITAEIRRGLVEGAEPGGEGVNVPLGDGTDVLAAIWGAVARIRELVTMRSDGAVRFHGGGPEGAVPLAAWTVAERRAGDRLGHSARRSDGVRLDGRRAVVVDDDPAIVWFLSGLLRTSGVEVAEAHDGLRARDLVFDGLPDLVVSDVLMPGLDGFSLCREIKRDIAVSDVPVILLSWKEDLLQRVRELGVSADGYLRKEAAASTVLQRVREVLRPRARIEARLAAGGEVRGRVDGLTMRLVLELTRRHLPSSRVVVRDSVYLYELEMREGRPRCVSRTASDGSFERGGRVMDALIGVNAGRFVIAPNTAACRDELHASLDEVLKPRIRRARLLARVLDGNELDRVRTVKIDSESIAGYVAATPEPVRRFYERLLSGEGPRAILEREPSARAILEQVLFDVARHGAVRGVVRDDGPVDLEASSAPPSVVLHESIEETSPPLFTLELSPAPPEVENAILRWEQPLSSRLPLNQVLTPRPLAELQLTPAPGFREEPGTAPGVGPPSVLPVDEMPKAPPPAPARPPPPAPPRPVVVETSPTPPPLPVAKAPKLESAAEAIPGEPAVQNAPTFENLNEPVAPPATGAPSTLPSETPEPASSAKPPPPPRRDQPPALPSTRPIEFPSRAKTPEKAERAAKTEPPKRPASPAAAAAPAKPVAPRASAEDKSIGAGKIALLTVVAAGISFGVVTLVRNFTSAPAPTAATAPESSAAPSGSPAAAALKAAAALSAEELGLPPGVPVGNDKGLLEIEVGGRHAVYVDGTFVGRGPTRRIPLAPGPHQVMVKLPEGDSNLGVDLKAGRRTRVALPGQ